MKKTIILSALFLFLFILLNPQAYALSLFSPQDGQIFTETKKPAFTWQAVPEVISYHLQVSSYEFPSHSFNWDTLVLNQDGIAAASYRLSSDLSINRSGECYYWRVRYLAPDESGMHRLSDWSRVKTFRVWPPAKPLELKFPLNGGSVDSIRPEFEWIDPPHYREHRDKIQVSTDREFRNIVFEENVRVDGRGALLSPVDLEYGRTYYWRVRFERWLPEIAGGSRPGLWNEDGNFNVYLPLPPQVFLISPRNHGSVSSLAAFTWNSVPNATDYNLLISDEEDFSNTVLRLFSENSSLTTNLSIADGTYYWRVRARNASGWGEWSDSRQVIKSSGELETEPPSETEEETEETGFRPELYSPKGRVETDRPEFSWRGYVDTPARNPGYHIQIATDSSFTGLMVNNNSLRDTSYQSSRSLTAGYTYYWRVRARERSSDDWGPWSREESFWLSLTSTPVTLKTPRNNAILRARRPNFSWEAELPYGYRGEFELEVSDRSNFYTSIFRTTVNPSGEGGSRRSPQRLSDSKYYWHVRQKMTDESNWGSWSEPWSFTIDITPPEIKDILPAKRKISTSTIPARVTISCKITDNLTGVDRVEYYLGRKKVAQRTRPHHNSTYVADITGLNEGSNTVTIKAYDKSLGRGNMAETSLTFEVKRILGVEKPSVLPKKFKRPPIPNKIIPKERFPRR